MKKGLCYGLAALLLVSTNLGTFFLSKRSTDGQIKKTKEEISAIIEEYQEKTKNG